MNAVVVAPVSFTPKYQIGDKVWFVATTTTGMQHDCPDCLGSKKWPITSPAGVAMEMDCPRCTKSVWRDGLDLGYTKHIPWVKQLTIGSVRIDTADRESPISYMCEETGVGSGSVYREIQLHDNKDAADRDAAAQCAACQAETDAKPVAMLRAERSRLGYFTAIESALFDDARARALAAIRTEFSGDFEESEHTPGVWRAEGSVSADGLFSFSIRAEDLSGGYDSKEVCSGYGGLSSGFATHEQGPANARLIAAAPRLLRALESAEEFVAGFEGDELQEGIAELLTDMRAAIAKAVQA